MQMIFKCQGHIPNVLTSQIPKLATFSFHLLFMTITVFSDAIHMV